MYSTVSNDVGLRGLGVESDANYPEVQQEDTETRSLRTTLQNNRVG